MREEEDILWGIGGKVQQQAKDRQRLRRAMMLLGIFFKMIIRGYFAKKNPGQGKGDGDKGEEMFELQDLSSSGNRGHVVFLIGLTIVAAWV